MKQQIKCKKCEETQQKERHNNFIDYIFIAFGIGLILGFLFGYSIGYSEGYNKVIQIVKILYQLR